MSNAFQFRNVAHNLAYLWGQLRQLEGPATVASLFGRGSYFGPAFVLLFLMGLDPSGGLSAALRDWTGTIHAAACKSS
ncbi:MAG: hypothetical protein ACE5JX_15845 [Acidobacteriota bacterium]